jgi:hypothetical protein
MMPVKKKSDLDLDFNEAAPVEVKKEPTEPVVEKPKTIKEKDIFRIMIPTKNPYEWYPRLLHKCTPEEFDLWFKNVYPGIDSKPEDFVEVIARLRAFQHVLKESTIFRFKDKKHFDTVN